MEIGECPDIVRNLASSERFYEELSFGGMRKRLGKRKLGLDQKGGR